MKGIHLINIKKLLVLLPLLCIPILLFSQETEKATSYFVALYTLGESWDADKQPHEQAYFKEHSSFLSKLRKEKKISVGARYSDTGMLIIKGSGLQEVKNMLYEDVAIQHKLFKLEIHPFAPFYQGCVE
ncbi:hypothetical protein [Flagellimonas myxillae]|uniref:hypothetical protein n=1 Tax=Flagellimonas myxillae TaxID=2942214 RepID=UPI00201E7828|nr:hypothetical protein [Muricauda myxillae]MCL6267409.1 hypothetical protein [Muricauda myxillae]